jgi:hypothetical protein
MASSILPLFAFALVASAPALASELVPLPQFDAVELRGGGNVTVAAGPVERVTIVEGSTRFTRVHVDRNRTLKIETCDGACPPSYRLRVQIESPNVPTLVVDGGGSISAASGFGPQGRLVLAVNGGGIIDTRAVDAGDVTAAVNGGGKLFVRARSALTGAVHGGGSVLYWGNPQVTTAIQGGGSVQPAH